MSNGAVNIAVAGLNLDIYLFILKGHCILMSICKCPWQVRKKLWIRKYTSWDNVEQFNPDSK